MKHPAKQWPKLLVLIVLIAALALISIKHQAAQDWFRLRNYHPSATVSQLATDTTMTSKARNLFYVNHTLITTGSAFTSHCPSGGEKTVVLGCYVGADDGIYIYKVTDKRLSGVEQVTAAHETLHAAYRRLSSSQRSKVDTMLLNYYNHDLTDQRIKDTIAAYKKSEPDDVVNEMHSVFGTEIANLPTPLEQYYRQYFTNRATIVAYTASYQSEFTSRQAVIISYDGQLQSLKQQITTDESALTTQKTAIDAQNQQMQAEQSSGDTASYNANVTSYNSAVATYNSLIETTKSLIAQYNGIVTTRNSVVLEEQQLSQDISANSVGS